MDKLPEVLNEKQKIHNLMTELVPKGKIKNRGSRG